MSVDISDPKQVKKRKTKQQLVRERELVEMRDLVETSGGKGFLWRLLSRCHMFHTISNRDSSEMSRQSGERDVGLWIIAELDQADKSAYIKLYKENQERENG